MKKILFLILFIIACINTFAQSDNENMLKYWHYRDRLKYFVIPGTKQGESEILSERNNFSENTSIHPDPLHKWSTIGQHGVYFGYYLSVLATEYKLLIDNGQNNEAANTLQELDLALNQFRNYMDRCEHYWPGKTDIEDGFFVRENMPCDFLDTDSVNGYNANGESHLNLLNKNLTTSNVWDTATHTFHGLPAGHPGYTDFIDARMCNDTFSTKEPMSQDEAIGVLQGLALIKKYCPASYKTTSYTIACNIITYIRNRNNDYGASWWTIYLPDGSIDPGGIGGTGDAGRFAWGFVQASKFFNNSCITDYNNPESWYPALLGFPSDELLWQSEGVTTNPIHDYNDDMKVILAAIGKSWHWGITITVGYCPVCFHIPFYIQTTGMNIYNIKSHSNAETFYLLLYEVLQNKHTNYLWKYKATSQLNSAPCEGPYNYGDGYHPANDTWGGWSASYRWRMSIDEQQGDINFPANFNGLDYMLFYNLYHIIYGGIPYEDYISRYLTGTVNSPIKYVAFDSIYSTQTINQTQPLVEYKAGEQIELKPGFHAVHGSNFHAYIAPTNCGDSIITDTIPQASVDTLTEDSMVVFTIPCDSMSSYGLSDTALVHFNGVDFDSTGTFNYHWDFGTWGTPSTSDSMNPSVSFICGNLYNNFVQLILTKDSTDTTSAISDTITFSIYKPCCDSSGSKMLTKKPELNSSNYQVNVFPNPTTGIFNVSCSDNSLSYSIEVSDVIGNIIYNVKNVNGLVQLDLSSNPKGIYFVKVITSDKKIYYRKIIYNE